MTQFLIWDEVCFIVGLSWFQAGTIGSICETGKAADVSGRLTPSCIDEAVLAADLDVQGLQQHQEKTQETTGHITMAPALSEWL